MSRTKFFLLKVVAWCFRRILSLRYRVIIRGFDEVLKKRGDRGLIFLPNHTSNIDPILLLCWFWPFFQLRPLMVDFIAYFPVVGGLHPVLRSILVPDFETSVNQYKVEKAKRALEELSEGLKHKDSFLVFPSGRFKDEGKEELKGTSSVHQILSKNKDVDIVLCRITGFWGSRFSKALIGKSPDFIEVVIKSLKNLCKNLLFFMPRRKIYIDFEMNPASFPREGSRIEINQFLQNWYNQYPDKDGNPQEVEPLNLVREFFFSKELPKVERPKLLEQTKESKASKDAEEKIICEIQRILDQPDLKISKEMQLAEDLGMDSLNRAEIAVYLLRHFPIRKVNFVALQSVQDLINAALSQEKQEEVLGVTPSIQFPEEKKRPPSRTVKERDLFRAFLDVCEEFSSFSAIGDDTVGILSYKEVKKRVLVFAKYCQKLPEKHIGVLLPASVGSMILIFAILFAGKVPVSLNWTLGSRHLEQAVSIGRIERIFSSWRFMEKLNFADFGSTWEKIELLEDVRNKISLKEKLQGLLLSTFSKEKILSKLGLDKTQSDQTACILFTSGSEAQPKGVPLSHGNLIANLKDMHKGLKYIPEDVFFCVLPHFHCFGLSTGTFLPFLSGMKLSFYPDPTDLLKVKEGIFRWKATFFPIVPTLFAKLLELENPEEMKSIRSLVLAGEKTPQPLISKIEKLLPETGIRIGYGLTETSPCIAARIPEKPLKGVGEIFPDIEAVTVHPESLQKLPEGEEGELCVRGPNIFAGYLGNAPSPFIEIDGKKWFRTGDLAKIDKDRTLYISGRLKRFVKLGGEMISLGGIEESLRKECESKGSSKEANLALCSKDFGKGAKLFLFTTFALSLEEVNEMLKRGGFSNLIKISKIIQIDQIPLMATGKIHYRALEETLSSSNFEETTADPVSEKK